MTDILIIPDAHSRPHDPGHRLTWLGRFIADEQPDTIVMLGDFFDMESLSSYDKGKARAEGKRVKEDIEWGRKHLRMLYTPLLDLQTQQRRNKQRMYMPDIRFLMGNHEHRILRAENDLPALQGMLDVDPSETLPLHMTTYSFLEFCNIEGITFSHYFPSGMGRALGGVSPGKTILSKNLKSCVMGHSHIWDMDVRTNSDGEKQFGLSAGWYGCADHEEEWSKGSDHAWWNGVTMLYDVKRGFFREMRMISQELLKRKYQ